MLLAGVVALCCSQFAAAEDMTGAMVDEATYSLVATFRVKEGQVDRFIEEMKANTAESRKEPGVVVYRSYRSEKEPNVFVNIEAYKNKKAFETHLETPHVKKIGPILEEILIGEIEVDFILNY